MSNTKLVKKDFPIFKNNPDLVYLDSTATSLKPKMVLDAMSSYYEKYSANVFRGLYSMSEKATAEYEITREKVAKFINARSGSEIIFVRNTTEAINLIAYSWGKFNIEKGDKVVTTIMEHHSNFVPWQQLCKEKGAKMEVIAIDKEGKLKISIPSIKQAKLLAITQVSNVLGTINPVKEIIKEVRKVNPKCIIVVDGAQAVPHMKVDVQDLGCDFYCFSAHKMLGPTGIGVLWGRRELLDRMSPFNYGGEMISKVTIDETSFKETPYKFEAGTPHIAGVIGLGAAVDYLSSVGMDNIREHEIQLTKYALSSLTKIKNITIYGPNDANLRGGVISFTLLGAHPHDISQILDSNNICIRSGNHCAMPLHTHFGLMATSRASFYLYNTKEDVDKLVKGIVKVNSIFKLK